MLKFPSTLLEVGPNFYNDLDGQFMDDLYNNDLTLVYVHPNTRNFIPMLATHWAVGPDNKTVYYKLDKRARWSDGTPVTAEDYLFTFEFYRSPHIQSPFHNHHYENSFAGVYKHSDDVISVVTKKPYVKASLLLITALYAKPRHFFNNIDENFITNYSWRVNIPTTGPYQITGFEKDHYITLKRQEDWWAKDLKYFKNRFNIDVINYRLYEDKERIWQAFVEGELSTHMADDLSLYHEKAKGEVFDCGYIKKYVTYLDTWSPWGVMWLNQYRFPLTDPNVRSAFAHAMDFDKVIDDVLGGEYARQQAMFRGYGEYDNKSIVARKYDIEKVIKYMTASGWTMGGDGYWEKNNKPISITLTYVTPKYTPQLLVLQEGAHQAGFDLQLNLGTRFPEASVKNDERDEVFWYAGSWTNSYFFNNYHPPPLLPFYEYFFYLQPAQDSSLQASEPVQYKTKLDRLIDEYDKTYNLDKHQQLSREILQTIHDEVLLIPGVFRPFSRQLVWRGWRYPKIPGVQSGFKIDLIWFDPDEQAQLKDYQALGKCFDSSVIEDRTHEPLLFSAPLDSAS